MTKFILGKKIGMSQVFKEDGAVIPVTLVEAGPVTVTKLRTKEKDGYEAIQIGSQKSKIKNPRPRQAKRGGQKSKFENLKEFKPKFQDSSFKIQDFTLGQKIDVSIFEEGEVVKISGVSKGKGFQGGVKRHGFHGMPASHGHKHVTRTPGSIGQRFPQHTLKGTRMAGHMGHERVTVEGLKVVKVDKENNILLIKGAIPGRRGTLVEIVNDN
ncbi:MAG: 50S ribosomal protein L3 [Parcubacteria group bacterium]|nr:50S ribosomal protein L3 [Parcubacteria group bacterium]